MNEEAKNKKKKKEDAEEKRNYIHIYLLVMMSFFILLLRVYYDDYYRTSKTDSYKLYIQQFDCFIAFSLADKCSPWNCQRSQITSYPLQIFLDIQIIYWIINIRMNILFKGWKVMINDLID